MQKWLILGFRHKIYKMSLSLFKNQKVRKSSKPTATEKSTVMGV